MNDDTQIICIDCEATFDYREAEKAISEEERFKSTIRCSECGYPNHLDEVGLTKEELNPKETETFATSGMPNHRQNHPKRQRESDSRAMHIIRNFRNFVRASQKKRLPGNEEIDISFIIGAGTVSAQVDTPNDPEEGFTEARCSEGHRHCALLQALEDREHGTDTVHCGCQDESPTLTPQSIEDIMHLSEDSLKAGFGDETVVAEKYL